MSYREALAIAWRRKLIVLVTLILVVTATSFLVSRQERVYRASATVALLPDGENIALVPFYGQAVANLLPTYAQLVESRTFMDSVADDLPFETTGAALLGSVHADPVANVGVLRIVAQSGAQDRVAPMAQATAEAFVEELGDNGIVELSIIDEAREPAGPISPTPMRVEFAAAIVGLALGAGAAIAWERLFGRIRTARELAGAAAVPVLGIIPEVKPLRGSRRIFVGDPQMTQMEEALRAVRTNLLFAGRDSVNGAIVISGLNPGDGKSTMAANLAVMIAEVGMSVLLIDGDIHRPVVHEMFDVPNDAGLTSTVLTGAEPAALVRRTRFGNVSVVTSGPSLRERSQELNLYLTQLPRFRDLADIVLIDSPPLRSADDVRLLAAFAGGVVLLLSAGSSSVHQLRSAVDGMQIVGANVLGTVLTMAREGYSPLDYVDYYREAQVEEVRTRRGVKGGPKVTRSGH